MIAHDNSNKNILSQWMPRSQWVDFYVFNLNQPEYSTKWKKEEKNKQMQPR